MATLSEHEVTALKEDYLAATIKFLKSINQFSDGDEAEHNTAMLREALELPSVSIGGVRSRRSRRSRKNGRKQHSRRTRRNYSG